MSDNKKALVAYFSCSGVTRRLAETISAATGADLYEIKPVQLYTSADLNWNDSRSRSSVEMNDSAFRPPIAGNVENMAEYKTVFIGFPIWWYVALTIINTFLESYDFSGKTIIPFATSGSSGMGESEKILQALCPKTVKWECGKRLSGSASDAEVANWINSFDL